MSRLKKVLTLLLLVYLVGLGVWYFYTTSKEIHDKHMADHSRTQMVLARQAATNIETYFGLLRSDMHTLSSAESIIDLSSEGKRLIAAFHKSRKTYVSGITRVDARGTIQYTIPQNPDAIGKSVLGQRHNRQLFESKRPVLSEVITLIQGYKAIVFAYPIFDRKGTFQGALSLLISHSQLVEHFFSHASHHNRRNLLVLFSSGSLIYCPSGDHIGHKLHTTKGIDTTFREVLHRMLRQESGTASFRFPQGKRHKGPPGRQLGAFTHAKVPGGYWSLLVSTPETEVLFGFNRLRSKWVLFLLLFGLGLLLLVYLLIDAFIVVSVVKKREKTERALARSQRNFKEVIEHLPIGLIVADRKGSIEFINERLVALCGDIIKQHTTLTQVMDTIAPDAQTGAFWKANLQKFFDGTIKLPNTPRTFETPIKCPGLKGQRQVSVTQNPMEGKLIVAFEDITERKQMEKAEQALLASAQRAKKMETVGLMAGGVAHDLNNMLSGVVSYPDLLLMDLPRGSEMAEALTEIRDSGKRAAEVVSDLLTATRGIAAEKRIIDVGDLVSTFISSPECEAIKSNNRRIQLKLQIPQSKLPVRCSPIHITKSLLNLCTNAFEAIGEKPDGVVGISLSELSLTQPLPGFEVVLPGEYVVITVSDNADGISQEDKERIFEPFYTKKVMGRSGTGLGLAIVWNTIRDHEGYIGLESDSRGTTFSLYFPRAKTYAQKSDPTTEAIAIKGNGRKVLIIDDEKEQRTIASKFLTALGFTVFTVASGEEAVAFIHDTKVDLLLLDMIMEPGMNGLETYRQIVQIHPGQKAIIVSGYAQNDNVVRAFDLGVGDYLQKPWTVEDLKRSLSKVLG